MNTVEESIKNGEVSRAFETLFHGKMITGYEYGAVFSSFSHGSASLVSFVKEMQELGVILFCKGTSICDYIFTKTHMLEYSQIDRWDIVNKPAKYDDSDTWICNKGELKAIIPLSDITNIEVGEGNQFYSWSAETILKDKNPVKGAVIGGALAGPTGAVVGAIANSGKKEVIVMPSGFVSMNKVMIKLTVKGQSKLEMIAASANKSPKDNNYVIDNMQYYNRINSALSSEFSFSGSTVNNGTAANRITTILSKYIDLAKKEKKVSEEAHDFWRSHPEEESTLVESISFLNREYAANRKTINNITTKINAHVRETREDIEEKLKEQENILSKASIFKRGKIKKIINELQLQLDNCNADNPFDDIMAERLKHLSSLKEKDEKIERLIDGFKTLKKDISSSKQQKYFDTVLNSDIHPLDKLF